MRTDPRLQNDAFPRSSAYHPDWVLASASGGANSLWLTEWLAEALKLQPGMRVLDLGCGLAASSVFMAREFDVAVWATDLWFDPTINLQRVRDAGVEDRVFPLRADARALPFARDFFDLIVSIDAYPYFGTDYHYLWYLAPLVKPGGAIAHAGAGLIREFDGPAPEHLRAWWDDEPQLGCLHSPHWWREHWERTKIVDVEVADTMPDGWRRWVDWHRVVAPDNVVEIQAIEADRGATMGYVRVVGRRRADAQLHEPVTSIPSEYEHKPLLSEQT